MQGKCKVPTVCVGGNARLKGQVTSVSLAETLWGRYGAGDDYQYLRLKIFMCDGVLIVL